MAQGRSASRALLVLLGTIVWFVGGQSAGGRLVLPPSAPAEWTVAGRTLPDGYAVVIRGNSNRSRKVPAGRPPIYVPYMVAHTGTYRVAACVGFRVENPPAALYDIELVWAEEAWNRLADVRRCLATKPAPAPSVSNWTEIVQAYLPRPGIVLDPARGIVNIPEYLSITGALSRQLVAETNLGRLAIDATGTIQVRVDGTSLGWFNTLGGPWPYGDIQFRPTAAGTYSIVAVEEWSGSFLIGGRRFTLPPVGVASTAANVEISPLTSVLQSAS